MLTVILSVGYFLATSPTKRFVVLPVVPLLRSSSLTPQCVASVHHFGSGGITAGEMKAPNFLETLDRLATESSTRRRQFGHSRDFCSHVSAQEEQKA